jgi:hypothetical protein
VDLSPLQERLRRAHSSPGGGWWLAELPRIPQPVDKVGIEPVSAIYRASEAPKAAHLVPDLWSKRVAREFSTRCPLPRTQVNRTSPDDLGVLIQYPTILFDARLKLIRGRHPIHEWAHPPLCDPPDELEEVLLR